MILELTRNLMPGFRLLLMGLVAGIISPAALAEPPIGESMTPSIPATIQITTGRAASLIDVQSVTCITYTPPSFDSSFCAATATGAYGGEAPVIRRQDEPIDPPSWTQSEGLVDMPRDFTYIQIDGNWVSKEHARWRLPQLELKL